jgi:UDP-N-acetylmuramate--alanine ligase
LTAVNCDADGSDFVLSIGQEQASVRLGVPGTLNIDNALAAAAACCAAGLSVEACARGLGAYRGVGRRYQKRGTRAQVTVIDDYAHHPTEVRRVIEAARSGRPRRVVAVFQPHRYSRTEALWREFGAAFEGADAIVVTEVYGAGEQPIPGVSGKLLTDAIAHRLPGRPVAYLPRRDELIAYLVRSARAGDAVLTLGAGDITSLGDDLLSRVGGGS